MQFLLELHFASLCIGVIHLHKCNPKVRFSFLRFLGLGLGFNKMVPSPAADSQVPYVCLEYYTMLYIIHMFDKYVHILYGMKYMITHQSFV
jgi:hypothetical protein